MTKRPKIVDFLIVGLTLVLLWHIVAPDQWCWMSIGQLCASAVVWLLLCATSANEIKKIEK